jgi:hypothetical protein
MMIFGTLRGIVAAGSGLQSIDCVAVLCAGSGFAAAVVAIHAFPCQQGILQGILRAWPPFCGWRLQVLLPFHGFKRDPCSARIRELVLPIRELVWARSCSGH